MSHAVAWTAAAARARERLPEKVAGAAIEFSCGSLAESPQRVGRPLRFELEGLHGARRGDYRVVYEIDPAGAIVTIVAIQHRADVYRSR